MNITPAIESSASTIQALRSFPICNRLELPDEIFISDRRQRSMRNETLSGCLPVLGTLKNEIENELNKVTSLNIESVENRYNFIQKKHFEALSELQQNSEKFTLISEIERLEKTNHRNIEKIIFNKEESIQLIKNLHSAAFAPQNESLEDILKENVEIEYDNISPVETETLRRVIELLHNM